MPISTSWARRVRRSARHLAPVAFVLAAACGGGDGTPTEVQPTRALARVDVDAQFVVAPTTTPLTLRASAAYELAAGGTAPLADVTVAVPSTAAQTVPVSLDITPCVTNPARAGADQGAGANAVCRVVVQYALLSNGRVVDAQTFGTYTLRGGTVNRPQAVTFVEITGVRVTRADGAVLADGAAARLELGQTLALTATALRADNAAVGGRPVRWTSETPGVAAVDAATGVVTPVAAGQARIVASVGGLQSAVVVTVVPPPAPVTVSVAGGTGSGTVTSQPAGINCRVTSGQASGTCALPFPADGPVTLTAVPDAGSDFVAWGGDCASAAGATACTFSAPLTARSATVQFARRRVAVAIQLDGPAPGTVTLSGASVANGTCSTAGARTTCTATFDQGTVVTANTTPGTGAVLGTWSGGVCAGPAGTPCTFTASADAVVATSFPAIPAPPPPGSGPTTSPVTFAVLSTTAEPRSVDVIFERRLNGQQANSGSITLQLTSQGPQPAFSVNADVGTVFRARVRRSASVGGRITRFVCAGVEQPIPDPTGDNNSCQFNVAPTGNAVVITVAP